MQQLYEKKFVQWNTMTFLNPALLIVLAVLSEKTLFAQSIVPQATQQTVGASSDPPRRSAEASSPSTLWPADRPPNPAIVRWDSRGLEIEAANSSLEQILLKVAADTGAKLEGLTHDQRIFGSYGPGPGCDVLSKLLEGSGYNVIMRGSRNADMPLEIVLSARSPVSPQMAANSRARSYSQASKEPEPEQRPDDSSAVPSPKANQDPYNVGGPPRDPVQLMGEILQRQHVIDQQQEQQDQRSSPQ